MYAVKVEVKNDKTGEGSSASTSGAFLVPDVDAGPCSNAEVDEIQVSVGNPRVEHLTGIVHLYRQTHEAGTFSPKLPVQPPPACPLDRIVQSCAGLYSLCITRFLQSPDSSLWTSAGGAWRPSLCACPPCRHGCCRILLVCGSLLATHQRYAISQTRGWQSSMYGPPPLHQRSHH